MRFLQHALAAISLTLIAATATASPTNPQNGVDYQTLDRAQPTESGKKVEVTEFFWYSCPHCNAFDPALTAWVKKQGNRIAFKRVPVEFRESFVPQQKLYYTLKAMGKLDELHSKVFYAIHHDRLPLDTDEAIADFVAKQGVDKQKFLDVYNSFGVQTKARRATELQQDYQINGVPTIAIDGRYLTSPSIVSASVGNKASEAELHTATLQVMDALVSRVEKERNAQGATKAKKK